MPVSLAKGQQISLEKTAGAQLGRVILGLGWDSRKPGFWGRFFGAVEEIDLDASCIMMDDAGQVVDTVWFRQLRSKDGSVTHTGDNRTGDGDGDDEQIIIDLARVPPHVQHLVFVVNSFTGQTFNQIENAFCRLIDLNTRKVVARYDLTGQGSHTAQVMTRLYREGNDWKLQAIGEKSKGRTFNELLPTIRRLILM